MLGTSSKITNWKPDFLDIVTTHPDQITCAKCAVLCPVHVSHVEKPNVILQHPLVIIHHHSDRNSRGMLPRFNYWPHLQYLMKTNFLEGGLAKGSRICGGELVPGSPETALKQLW